MAAVRLEVLYEVEVAEEHETVVWEASEQEAVDCTI
jgi:hypothetical protein